MFKEYIYLFLVSVALAVPVAVYIVSRWLMEFAYKAQVEASAFVLTAVIALIIIVISTGYHILKVLSTSPVVVLRKE